jgi:site-specific recombinase XerD
MTDRNRSMYVSDVREFAKANPLETVEGLTGAVVQAWISSLDIAPKTINRKLSSLRNYWGWLQAHEVAQVTNKPFHGRKLPKGKKDAVKRQAFQTADIPKLIAQAQADRDGALADLITLAAYTGLGSRNCATSRLGMWTTASSASQAPRQTLHCARFPHTVPSRPWWPGW